MKQVGVFIALIFTIVSCNQSATPVGKSSVYKDTLAVAYETKGQNNWQLVRATYAFDTVWAYGDKNISDGKYKIDTAKWKFYIMKDTMRDVATRKPIFDTASRTWKMQWDWYELSPKEKDAISVKPLAKLNK